MLEAVALLVPGRENGDAVTCTVVEAAKALVDQFGDLFFDSVASDDTKTHASESHHHMGSERGRQKSALNYQLFNFMNKNAKKEWKGGWRNEAKKHENTDICKHINIVLNEMAENLISPQVEEMLREFLAFILSSPVTTVIVEAHFSMYTRQTCTKRATVKDETVANICLFKDHVRAEKIELGLDKNTPKLWIHLLHTYEGHRLSLLRT